MEFNRTPRQSGNQRRLNIPRRLTANKHEMSAAPQTPPIPTNKKPAVGSSSDRTLFGFDDIPVDDEKMDDVRFVDILKAWMKRAVQHSPVEKYFKSTKKRKEHINQIKNDIKWAMQADLDEPVAPRPKRQKPTPVPKHVQSDTSPADSKTIDININFGSLPKIRRDVIVAKSRQLFSHKKPVAIIAVSVIVIFSYFVIWPPVSEFITAQNQKAISDGSGKTPDYQTVLPKNKSISELGGWNRVSPKTSNPVFAYSDRIGDVTISVSQQPLPESFRSDIGGKVAELAKQFTATDKVDANGTAVYIGTSAKGPQSVIFTKNGLLILIKSQQKTDDKSWIAYVQSLVGTDPSLSHF